MEKKCDPAEQIINHLREASRQIGVTNQTNNRWRKEYGGMGVRSSLQPAQ